MSAGDLVNNLGKLEQKLKQINFRNFRRSEILSGTLDIYISIYGYVFSSFNRELSKLVASHELELYGKTSKRFVHNLYLIVRDILNYKPPITKDMFLSNFGFVEMKMIMCTQILELVLAKCKQLPSSDKTKKTYRKIGSFSSLSTHDSNGKNNSENFSDSENANNVTTCAKSDRKKNEPNVFMLASMQRKISTIKHTEKKLNSQTKFENTDKNKTTTEKPNDFLCSSCHHHLSSNYSNLLSNSNNGQHSTGILRHSNDCAISKNPVSKCNVARSSYAKGKRVVLEKQEPPPQKVDIKVLKGPLQNNDGFSGGLRIIPPEELSSGDISFYQNAISNARNSVSKNPIESTGFAITAIPSYTENDNCVTTPGSEASLLSFLTSNTTTKPPKDCPVMTATIPTTTTTTKQKCPPKSTITTEYKIVENNTMLKPSDENNHPKRIDLLSSNSAPAVVTTKVADVQNPKPSSCERFDNVKVNSQIKKLTWNLTGCAKTLRQMRERSKQWDTQNMFPNSSDQNKENTPAPNRETIHKPGCVIKEDGGCLSKTNESKEQTHQLDHWIAKMNLMECAVKSLESKFKSL